MTMSTKLTISIAVCVGAIVVTIFIKNSNNSAFSNLEKASSEHEQHQYAIEINQKKMPYSIKEIRSSRLNKNNIPDTLEISIDGKMIKIKPLSTRVLDVLYQE